MNRLLRRVFGAKGKARPIADFAPKDRPASHDPLDVFARSTGAGWGSEPEERKLATIADFQTYTPSPGLVPHIAMDSSEMATTAQDSAESCPGIAANGAGGLLGNAGVPANLESWYASQTFIGYQSCSIIAQHWLVDKACSQSGEDAARNGWELKSVGDELNDDQKQLLEEFDGQVRVVENLTELNRFKNIFGIRVAIFVVESEDRDYYEKPFNIDGVAPGSYKGISQVDPYWMTPQLTSAATANPAGIHFYEPEFWVISGKKYHRSHLIISRGPQPSDVLKPTYIFGGIPLTQRIYERVYAAERTANEAPLLALNKRTTAIHVDVGRAMANEKSFVEKILFWVKYRDNHAVKVLGTDETMEQFDTSLTDFDSIIMNQYQLVAAIAKTPSTKLLGTSPKGFNATGEHETISYHEELESIQRHVMQPMLDRHYLLAVRSLGLGDTKLKVVWEPVGSITAVMRADLNLKKLQADQAAADSGAVSPDEIRNRLREDKHSGYNNLTDMDANDVPGMTPEAIAELDKAEGDLNRGEAAETKSDAQAEVLTGTGTLPAAPTGVEKGTESADTQDSEIDHRAELMKGLEALLPLMLALQAKVTPKTTEIEDHRNPGVERSVLPSVTGMSASVDGAGAIVEQMPEVELPSVNVGGMIQRIENPRGSIRKSDDWSVKMPHHYGYIAGTMGADGDEVDSFIGPNLESDLVFVINQVDKEGNFDEHKVMFGFDDEQSAINGYNESYSEGWDGLGSIHQLSIDELKDWLENGDTKTEYSPVG